METLLVLVGIGIARSLKGQKLSINLNFSDFSGIFKFVTKFFVFISATHF
jgi:hypothetical protein